MIIFTLQNTVAIIT